MKWMKKVTKITIVVVCVFMLVSAGAVDAYAADAGSILSKWVQDNQVVLILRDTNTQDIRVQIGTTRCDDVQVTDGDSEQIQTLILVDNSESIAEKYRPVIYELLINIIGSKGQNELFSIATFTDRMNMLVENSGDYSSLKKAVDSITYDSHDAWFVPVLYNALSGWQQDEQPVFHRIIVISDGASEERTGYTMEELNSKLQELPCPIYAIGAEHRNNDNKEELNRLFALSRSTKGKEWLLADITDTLEVASCLSDEGKIQRVTISPPAELCDGTVRGIQVEVAGFRDQTTMTMPFVNVDEQTEQPTEQETEEIVQEQTESQTEEMNTESGSNINTGILVGAVVLIAGVTVVALLVYARRKKGEKSEPEEKPIPDLEDDETVDVAENDNTEDVNDSSLTEDAFRRPPKLVLTDKNDLNQRFSIPMKGTIMVGRPDKEGKSASKIIIKDKSVSRSHCTFRCENSRLYLSDAGSKNGTIVNGKTILCETEVHHGDTITLGNVDLKVEILK